MDRNEILSEILGDTEVSRAEYPIVCWMDVDSSASSIVAAASEAWRNVDPDVSYRISDVLTTIANSYSMIVSVCEALCPEGDDDGYDDDIDEYDDEYSDEYDDDFVEN